NSRTTLISLTEKFNSLLPISEEQLQSKAAAAPAPPVVARPVPAPAAPAAEKEVVAPVHTARRETAAPHPAHVPDNSLNERFRATERPTLNENFRKSETASLADSHSNRKIE